MKHFLRASTALAATAAVLSIACVAVGQDQAPPGPGQPPSADHHADWQARREARAKALHDILNLRPDQEAAFQTLQAALAPPPRGERHDMSQAQGPMTTPQRLDFMAERMTRHEAEFRRRADAIRSFYAVLSPDQQRAFDALPLMLGGHQGMGHGHGDHGSDGGAPHEG